MGSGRSKRIDGRQLRWQRHNEKRRQVILDAAVDVLGQHRPGEEIHVQEIADKAGLSRTVVYRHFDDRSDLDLAVQREICARVGDAVLPAVSFAGSPYDIIRRIVDAYAHWAVDHPTLMRFVERDLPGVDAKPIDEELEQIAAQIEVLMNAVVELLGAELSEDDRDALVPWVFALVGGCFHGVRRWTARDELRPSREQFVDLMAQAIWFQIDGLCRSRGIELPTGPVEELIGGLGTDEGGA